MSRMIESISKLICMLLQLDSVWIFESEGRTKRGDEEKIKRGRCIFPLPYFVIYFYQNLKKKKISFFSSFKIVMFSCTLSKEERIL